MPPPTDLTLPLEELPDPLPIEPLTRPFDAVIEPPGSKSITNRVYVLAALAAGESRIERPLRADDTDRLLDALCTLGAAARREGDDVVITGVGGRFPRGGRVYLGDGGTPTRFMIAAACLAGAPVVVDGSPRMRERPVAEGVELLRALGARIEYVEADGRLPVRVAPDAPVRGGELLVPRTSSSQFISALMLVAPFLPDGVRLSYAGGVTSASYVEMTRKVMRDFGARLEQAGGADTIAPGQIAGKDIEIEPDASSAAYWYAAAAMIPDAAVAIPGLAFESPQPDIGVPASLAAAGASTRRSPGQPVRLTGGPAIASLTRDCSTFPDGALALAAVASRATGPSTLTGLRTLRVKESDRIAALATELGRLGCTVETTDDAITVDPATQHADPVVIETYGDHRIAMAFAVLGLVRPGISIANPACTAKSYRTFFRDLAGLYAGNRAGHT